MGEFSQNFKTELKHQVYAILEDLDIWALPSDETLKKKLREKLSRLLKDSLGEMLETTIEDTLQEIKEIPQTKVRNGINLLKQVDDRTGRSYSTVMPADAGSEDALRIKIEGLVAETVEKEESQEWFERFSITFRIQHILLFTSVIILILTGLPLKFPESWWAEFLFEKLHAFYVAKFLHRVGAVGLFIESAFHLFYITMLSEGRQFFMGMLPRLKDAFDAISNVKYFLGVSKTPARFDRFSYIEKFDYWAVYWGCVIMITSGLALWFQDKFMSILPKYFIDVLKEVHSDEALLATLALVIWHFYNVHFNPDKFPGSLLWWHGKISKEEIIKEHPLEYERIIKERVKGKG